ncbi:hypothetical protein BLS_004099 [Venturia inaequalis]|uniref:DUF4246 domain-containing protein n=1 Tax=Venturia inaequalis TaxID=5025 RepID=A0A8H3UP88_VENIN|nr:hypothetical protein BLS_004099 [Venturia inaequalis]
MITRILFKGCDHVKWVYEMCPQAKNRKEEPRVCDLDNTNENQQTASIPGREVDHTIDGPCGDEDCLVSFPDEDAWIASFNVGGGEVPPQYWSDTYQWLPANLAYQEDGKVKFTSYINNLHPTRYSGIYEAVQSLIDIAIPAWDQCLTPAEGYNEKQGAGRLSSRFSLQDNPSDENPENWIPSDPQEFANIEVNWDQTGQDRVEFEPEWYDETEKKWELLRKPVIPEPSFEDVNYTPSTGSRLRERFAESGLQVIVKLASVELTPEKPEFPVGGWHIEGQMNEHICATALYYLDSENITDSNLSFRMQTDAYLSDDVSVGQGAYHWLEQIWGTCLGHGAPCLQNYGSVDTRQGRLLAFPNVFQHQVSSFRLQDPTKPGHRRFIALWLVDPFQRIISTANVPPQQMDWWLDSVLGETTESRKEALSKLPAELLMLMKEKGLHAEALPEAKLPQELMALTTQYFNADGEGLLMSLEEAKEHRLKLMAERSAFVETADDGYHQHSYGFCEH